MAIVTQGMYSNTLMNVDFALVGVEDIDDLSHYLFHWPLYHITKKTLLHSYLASMRQWLTHFKLISVFSDEDRDVTLGGAKYAVCAAR